MATEQTENELEEKLEILASLIREVRLNYYQMKYSSSISGLNVKGISGAYGLMADLYHQGPKTVPQLLEDRAISRQYMHRLVRSLNEAGLLTFSENPEHKRSKILCLTEEGVEYFNSKRREITATLLPMAEELSEEKLRDSVDTLERLRDGFKQITDKLLKEQQQEQRQQ